MRSGRPGACIPVKPAAPDASGPLGSLRLQYGANLYPSSLRDATACLRAFRQEDIAQVVDLHGRVFGPSQAFTPSELGRYIEKILFDSPWRDEALPSLVALDAEGRISGFLGVVPRPMVFRGRRIRAAVGTQLMVDPQHQGRMTAGRLIKAFLSGPQDLSLSDGANEQARRVAMGLGVETALLYSMHWTRPLRPAGYLLSQMQGRTFLRPMAAGARRLGPVIDAVAARIHPNRFHQQPADVEDGPLELAAMLAHFPGVCQESSLMPLYDARSLAWLLGQASQKARHGKLRTRAVLDGRHRLIGWYLYYIRPGAVSEVIQVASSKGSFDREIGRAHV